VISYECVAVAGFVVVVAVVWWCFAVSVVNVTVGVVVGIVDAVTGVLVIEIVVVV